MFNPRPKQQEVLNYTQGWMGVAAVPGAGKTRTLSALAAKLLSETPLENGQEILIVTLVNSAVGNFARQIRELMQQKGMLTGYGYRIRTLHGLANDIVRERPELVGLSDNFVIIDEREAAEILESAVDAWLRGNPNGLDDYIDESYLEKPSIRNSHLPRLMVDVAGNFIRQAKDDMLMPDELPMLIQRSGLALPLAEMCAEIYRRYQQGLSYRGGVDFQDLIRLALKALQEDPDYLSRLRHRWVYILEDEAQDSDLLQEKILRALAGNDGNWVRVGDPNQAIYETFTTANPKYLREFIASPQVQSRELPNSGRSQPSIIHLANALIDWSGRHPVDDVRRFQPLAPPYIEPTSPDDPQPNPPDDPTKVFVFGQEFSPGEEIKAIVQSVRDWLRDNPDMTAAILVPHNKRGFDMVTMLKESGVEYVEMLRSTTSTREVAGAIYHILAYLANPSSADLLARVYRVLRRDEKDDEDVAPQIMKIAKLIRSCTQVETFIHPQGTDWLDSATDDPELRLHLDNFRLQVRVLHEAVSLPIDQLVLTISQMLFHTESELALAYSLSLRLRRDGIMQAQNRVPGQATAQWGFMEYAERLAEIAKNQRKFLGMSEDEIGFNPDSHKGEVTVATMHRAKGLEWDRVYLTSVNNYSFPSGEPHDSYIGEKWFVRDELNLDAEARAQLAVLEENSLYVEGVATFDARVEYAAERLRLIYVGITRARRELVMTWNNGRRGDAREATPMIALRTYWQEQTRS